MTASLLLPDPSLERLLHELVARAQALELAAPGAVERARAAALHRAVREALQLASAPAGEVSTADGRGAPAPLSRREREVLDLIARGLSNPEVAAVLGIALATVRTHVEHLLRKMDASNRVEAVALALRLGVL